MLNCSEGTELIALPDLRTWPLVSCIMPTFNRRPFITLALQHFIRQDYPNLELIIVDDGTDQVGDLVEGLRGVRYIRLHERISIGAKRNLACQEAQGEIIAHWDDDDWYAPNRLRYQVGPILNGSADITGLENEFVMTLPHGEFWTTGQQLRRRMFACDVHGGTLVFNRSLFVQGLRYPEVDLAEDAALLRAAVGQGRRLARLPNDGVFVYVRHASNAWQFDTGQFIDPDEWKRIEPPKSLPGTVLECYCAAADPLEEPPARRCAAADGPFAWLDSLPLERAEVGFGTLGLHGSLGYEDGPVAVRRRPCLHALSTHPPARVAFRVDCGFTRFVCQVALNDDVPIDSSADFSVFADGRLVASASCVQARAIPQILEADITGARVVELMALSAEPHRCHAVWVDPYVDGSEPNLEARLLVDCFDKVNIHLPAQLPRAERCIVSLVSPTFADMLDDMLGSLHANGACEDALVVVLAVDANEACVRVASKHGAFLVRCTSRSGLGLGIKGALLAASAVIDAEAFICLDADMLVLDDLRPVFAALEALPAGTVLACREGHDHSLTLGQALVRIYGGSAGDFERLLQRPARDESNYSLTINTGIIAGRRGAIAALDATIRGWPEAPLWMDERTDIWWRDQFLVNLAVAHLRCGVEMDIAYNLQLHVFDADLRWKGARVEALWQGRAVKVLHFSGTGRENYPEWRNLFSRVAKPLVGADTRDDYATFTRALRRWVGRYGLEALIWSFYGTPDGYGGRVRDRTMLPLLALLHYIIRANGCVRVLETGTARGVSAACLASAVARRPSGRVVTFDPYLYDGRAELWELLPAMMSVCIDQRTSGSLEGMGSALAAGERYDGALLDSDHSAEHVWAEFELATRLVCSGGLILIHDARFVGGEVPQTLERIERAGYGVARLWTADSGMCEDNDLGLAVIENRCRRVQS